jgi:hypothetical protein
LEHIDNQSIGNRNIESISIVFRMNHLTFGGETYFKNGLIPSTMQTNDELWKGAIEDLPMEFLHKFYPDLYPYIDTNHPKPIEFLDKELARLHGNSDIGRKEVDKLLGVRLRGIKEMQMIYIHVEAQGYGLEAFPERNFTYFYRLIDLRGKNVTMLVILTDDNPKYKPSVYRYDFMGVHLTYEFPIYKILEQNPSLLAASDNLFDATLLTAYWAIQKKRGKLREEDLVDLKLDLMRRLLYKNVDKKKIRRLFDFINIYVRFEKPEIAATFERQFDELTKIEKNMGITEIIIRQAKDSVKEAVEKAEKRVAEARAEARAEAAAATVAATVAATARQKKVERTYTVQNMRLKNFSAESIADILGYSLEEVMSIFNELDAKN